MVRPWILTTLLLLLGIGLWSSSEFTTVAVVVSVFLFGMIFLKDEFTTFTGGVLEKFLRVSTGSLYTRPLSICSSMRLLDTAMQVLVQKVGHLFDNAFEIIAHGLNIHRRDILSNRPLDIVVAKTRTQFDLERCARLQGEHQGHPTSSSNSPPMCEHGAQ